MNFDKSLNLVIPVERDDGTTVYVHSTPLSRETFDKFFLVIAKTFSAIYTQGLGPIAGPRVAAKMLKSVAADMGDKQAALVESELMSEMRRLSNVIAPSDRGWAPVPLHEAIARGLMDANDADEVENAVAFFMLASAMHKKKDAQAVLTEASKLWSAQITSSNSTAFAASLPTSTPAGSTGARAVPSLIAS